MLSLANQFHPITAAPFRHDASYCEAAPCDLLRPYIRCFWGTQNTIQTEIALDNSVVIPDVCMDMIFEIRQNQCHSIFVGIDDRSHTTGNVCTDVGTSVFGIRFYAWTAILFAERDMHDTKNSCFSADMFFDNIQREIKLFLYDIPDLQDRIAMAEKILLQKFSTSRVNADFLNAIQYILYTSGRTKISDICSHTAVSERTLERLFLHNMGISPKLFSSLVRYQRLWQDLVYHPETNLLDAVEKYGYTDQSHLLHDFRKRHQMTPKRALEFAQRNR